MGTGLQVSDFTFRVSGFTFRVSGFKFGGSKDTGRGARKKFRGWFLFIPLERNLKMMFHPVKEDALPLTNPGEPAHLFMISSGTSLHRPESPRHHPPRQYLKDRVQALHALFCTKPETLESPARLWTTICFLMKLKGFQQRFNPILYMLWDSIFLHSSTFRPR